MSDIKKSEKYPKGVWFMLFNIYFDRFSAGGIICKYQSIVKKKIFKKLIIFNYSNFTNLY